MNQVWHGASGPVSLGQVTARLGSAPLPRPGGARRVKARQNCTGPGPAPLDSPRHPCPRRVLAWIGWAGHRRTFEAPLFVAWHVPAYSAPGAARLVRTGRDKAWRREAPLFPARQSRTDLGQAGLGQAPLYPARPNGTGQDWPPLGSTVQSRAPRGESLRGESRLDMTGWGKPLLGLARLPLASLGVTGQGVTRQNGTRLPEAVHHTAGLAAAVLGWARHIETRPYWTGPPSCPGAARPGAAGRGKARPGTAPRGKAPTFEKRNP